MGGTGFDRANSVIATDYIDPITGDNVSAIYVAGSFEGTGASFGSPSGTPQTLDSLGPDAFVSKLKPTNGDFLWTKQIGGTGIQSARDLAIDEANNVYVSGNFNATADFDPGPGVYSLTPLPGITDGYVTKLNQAGDFGGWATHLRGSNHSSNLGLTVFGNSVFTTGFFFETLEACTGGTCSELLTNSSLQGGGNAYVMQLDADTGLSTDVSDTLVQSSVSADEPATDLALLAIIGESEGPLPPGRKRL